MTSVKLEMRRAGRWLRSYRWLAVCLALAVPASGCDMAGRGAMVNPGLPKTVRVTAQQAGQTIEAAVGDEIDVELPAQMGTGFSWQMLTPDAAVVVGLGAPELKSGASTQPGGAEMQVFRVKVQGKGGVPLRFEYRQPWAKDKAAAKTFAVTIHAS